MSRGHDWKVCKRCQQQKPLTDFRYGNSKRTYRRADCKSCEQLRKKETGSRERELASCKRRRKRDSAYRAKTNAMARKYGMTPRGRAARIWNAAKHRASMNKLEFTIERIHLECLIIIGVCQRTGIPFDLSSPEKGKAFNPYAPSLDRKDCSKGYTPENIQMVCNAYNLAKHQMTDEQFVAFCKIVVNYYEQ